MTNIANNLTELKNKIHHYEQRYHRPANSVTLLAVSKHQPLEKIEAAIAAGQTAFGENYLQEALTKMTALAHHALEWHFIGAIQSNKTRKIAEHFAWVHTVDNENMLQRLNDQRPLHLPPLNICLQVNISAEKTKAGVHPDRLLSLATACKQFPRLTLRGLMAIPAPHTTFVAQCAELHKLRMLYAQLCEQHFALDTLSMGMSDDMEAAIAEGATIVRIGTALFGHRIKL